MAGDSLPELVVCSAPHLQILGLSTVPESRAVRFIPDIDNKPRGHAISFHVREQL